MLAYTGNLSNTITTTGTAVHTGTNDAFFLYDIQGGSLPSQNDDLSLNSNTFTVSEITGNGITAKTIGKFDDPVLKVLEFDTVNTVAENTLLYNNSNQDFTLACQHGSSCNESYIFKANAIAYSI